MLFGMTMIKVSGVQERSVYDRLQKNPEVKDIYRLFGEYSFFLVMQAEEKSRLSRMLSDLQTRESIIKASPVLLTENEARPNGSLNDYAAMRA